MKGGIFSISETLVKIISVAYVATVILSIFFAINQYKLTSLENKMDREILVVGNSVLSSCIAESREGYVVKGLLSETKIVQEENLNPGRDRNMDCLKYDKKIYVEIYNGNTLLHRIGDSRLCENPFPDPNPCQEKSTTYFTFFPGALNRVGGTGIIPIRVKTFVGV